MSVGATALLDIYFYGRSATTPAEPRHSQARIRGIVLASRGSAPGKDGVPYELYHFGVSYVAALLQETLWAGQDGMEAVEALLGDADDLLIWIPKIGGATGPSALRRSSSLPDCGGYLGRWWSTSWDPH